MTDTPRRPAPLERTQELLESARKEIYKTTPEGELAAYVFDPDHLFPEQAAKQEGPRSAILFFSSSQWDQAVQSQFAPHALHFASRGLVSIIVEYRTLQKHGTGPLSAMADARSAMRWIRFNADALRIDPLKIAGAGGSAGAQLVLSTTLPGKFDDGDEDITIPCQPTAMVLFNPILDTWKKGIGSAKFPDLKKALEASPYHAIRKGLPPTLIFHGTADRVIPFEFSNTYARKARRKKNICELIDFEGQGHGFFNFNVDLGHYEATLLASDRFLSECGFLEPLSEEELEPRLGLA